MKKQALFKLTVLHTNDIHGNIDSLPQYSTVVNEIRKKEKNVLLLDSGDIYSNNLWSNENALMMREMTPQQFLETVGPLFRKIEGELR